MRSRKLLVIVFIFFLSFFFTSKPVRAEGSFFCKKKPLTMGYFDCVLDESKSDCAAGFKPGNCGTYTNNSAKCDKYYPCLEESAADPNECVVAFLGCPGEYPEQCPGTYSCCKKREQCGSLIKQDSENPNCSTKDGKDGVRTALGCIPVNDLNTFVAWLLKNLIFIATGIAFVLMVFGAVQILTSSGNPEKVKAGGELITSAISGLLLIILSLFLLKLIGVDILHIPGF